MAGEDSQEKTEEPTERRREDARERGQVVRSKELNTMVLIFGGVLTMYALSTHIAHNFHYLFQKGFSFNRSYAFDVQLLMQQLYKVTIQGMLTILPFLCIIFFIALLASVVIGGFNFSMESINFKWDRLDPINGLKKMVSWKSVVEFIKAILKFVLVVGFSIVVFNIKIAQVFLMDKESINVSIASSLNILLYTGLILAFSLVLIALIDIPFQFWEHARQLKMTKQEVRDDMQDTEGKPEVKRKIKERQRELLKRRMISKVPTANVIITNPTHFAIAIKYDETNMKAPIVVAKGIDLIAEMIKKVAKANHVPFVEAPPLARALYYHVELDEEIPSGLYVAVAKILAYIYELNLYHNGQGNEPVQPREFTMPKELES